MRLKLSHKITSLVAFAALLAGLAVGLADYSQASRELRGGAEAKLGALLEARKAAIEDYLDSIRRDLRSQAENPFLVESFQAFLVGWEELGPGAAATVRNLYHTANPHTSGERRLLDHAGDPSIYSLGHNRFHPRLRAFTTRYGYRDLLLVDRDGNVVYSVMKKADFATNLVHGPHRDTGLGRVFEAATAAAAGEAFSDFERYEPSDGRPTGFVGAALRNELDEIIGAVVLEMPVDRINQVMQVSAGLGRTGEALILGPDFLTRSDWQSDAGSTILSRRVETDPVRAALDGRSGLMASRENHPPQGSHDILAAFAPLDFLGTRWAIVVTADLAEVYGPVKRMRERAVVNGLLLACLVALLGVAVTRRVVVAPLSAVTAAVGRLASGDRMAKLPLVPRGDEIGDIARALVMFRDSLDERDRLVAEREQERHRREVRRRLAEAIESIPDGFALLDQDDRIVLVNQRMREIYPRSAHLLEPGRPYEEFLRNQAELGEIAEAVGRVEEFMKERMARLRNPRAPFEHRMTSGQWLRVADYRTEDGGALCIRSDITELKDREEALRASEERFRRLSEITFEGLLILDDGVIVDCNRAMLEMGGYESADLIGKSSLMLLAPEYRDFARQRVAARDERAYEAVVLRKDGSRAPVDLNFRHVTYGDRTLRVVTVRDITERKRAEQALRESEERFRAIAEAVPIPIVIIEVAENKLVFANAHAATMFGLPVDAAVRIRPDDYYADPEVSRPRLVREMESKGWIENLEVEMKRHDGSRFWALLSARPMTHRGQPAMLVGIIDISALKRTEVALRESESQVRAIVDTAADPIVMVDENRRILEFNPAAEKAFGYARDQILGQPMERILPPHLHDHNGKLFDAHLAGGLPSDLDRRIELEGLRADGSVFPAEVTVTEVPLSSGRVFTAYLRDLTETKRAEREIARQREQLYHSEKLTALGSLLAGVAHELNNPLSVVVGQATLLEETAPDPRTAARGQKIRAAADRCAKIVKTFLAMARRRQPERAAVNLNEVVRSALELVGYGLHTAGIKLELDLAEDLPDIWADPDQLNQVMTNLLVNAQHALFDVAEPRRLKVTTVADPSAGHLRVVVSDNGPGVPPEMRSRIFEPFFTTKPMGIGTGVGLSVCHGVVEAHGGTISVEDEPGGGARFVVTLPLVAPPVCVEGEAETPSPSGGRRLLIVDDEPEIAQVLAEILSSAGHVVDVVDSGQAALDRLGAADYDLIVSDIRMPNLDGPGLYRALLRKRPDLAARTIFITGDTLGTTAAGFLRQTRRPCIEKPFDAAEVRRRIEEALGEAPQVAV